MDFMLWLERLYDNISISRGETFPVYIDPTVEDLMKLGVNIRGMVDGDHIIVWKEEDAMHTQVARALNLSRAEETGFYLQRIGSKYRLFPSQHYSLQQLFLHPKIKKLYPSLLPYERRGDFTMQTPNFHREYQPYQPPQTAAG